MGVRDVFDNGILRVQVPPGWKLFYGIDSQGNPSPKKLHIYKNAQEEADILTHAGITVCFFDRQDTYCSPKFFYDNVKDIEAFPLGAYTWQGYTCTSFGYPYTMLEAEDKGCVFQVMILMKNGEREISLHDADVKIILESLTQANEQGGILL